MRRLKKYRATSRQTFLLRKIFRFNNVKPKRKSRFVIVFTTRKLEKENKT